MTRTQRATASGFCLSAMLWAGVAGSQPLTVERAVQIALEKNTQMVGALASEIDARGGLYGAYSAVLPQLSASLSRGSSKTTGQTGTQLFGTFAVPSPLTDNTGYSTTPSIAGSWSVLNLSALKQVSSARSALKASQFGMQAARSTVALQTRQQFYNVVSAYHLAGVADVALKLARDNERRVRALFEVGSVSRSDLLSARVQTANSQLDSLTANQNVVNQRIALAQALAMRETELGDVDTLLTVEPQEFDEPSLLVEASKSRPDLKAAEAQLNSGRLGLTAARLARLPYVSVSGSAQFDLRSSFTQQRFGVFPADSFDFADGSGIVHRFPPRTPSVVDPKTSGRSQSDRVLRGEIALNWDIFDGFSTDSRIASARARLLRAEENRDALRRNLEAEVHQALLQYRQAIERQSVANSAYDSARENLKLTQQKYNVGSTTILDLNTAQVNLTRAAADQISALASIRIAEAQLYRVRGQAE